MECALFYYQVMGCPLLSLPLIYLLVRLKWSRLTEHSNTFYHFFVWMEILSIAFIFLNAIRAVIEGASLGDLQYVDTLLLYFVHLLSISSSSIVPLLSASAVPKTPRVWDELFFRSLLILSLLLPSIVYLPVLIMAKDESLSRIDFSNIEFISRLLCLLFSSLISLSSIPSILIGVVRVEWAGESK
ncbi:hypothetical protein PMAYCL1PPCAC_02389, partial [Pristionchus mayeri]